MSRYTEKQLDSLVQLVKTGGQPMRSQACGCRVSVNPHPEGKPYAIVYCSLHQAAPALLEAANLWVRAENEANKELEGKAWFATLKAIATAEGRR